MRDGIAFAIRMYATAFPWQAQKKARQSTEAHLDTLSPVGDDAEVEKVRHPFLLWTADDRAPMRRKIETEPWARKAYKEMVASTDRNGDELRHLFRYAVMGDREAGEMEKKKVLGLLKAPDPLGASLEWRILAFDLLYNELTPVDRPPRRNGNAVVGPRVRDLALMRIERFGGNDLMGSVSRPCNAQDFVSQYSDS
jgi:hypothetical protein